MIKLKSILLEFPQISLKGKSAYANDKPLKSLGHVDVKNNIVIVRESNPNSWVAQGFTLVYFMDSDESAEAIKNGKLPYLMVPQGTFYSGGNPITDIWKKKFQSPGTEHILGVLEGNTTEEMIYINMLTVRPQYKRNSIASKMLESLKASFPKARIKTSSATDQGEKFLKSKNLKPGMNEHFKKLIKEISKRVFLKEGVLRGEWWIDDSGQALFADGDVGDMNHETYVADRLKREILSSLGVDTDDEFIGNYEHYKDEIFQNIGNELNPDELELWNDEIYEHAVMSYIKRTSPEVYEKVNYAYGRGDAREYAMKKWGWARVVRNNIQIDILTPDILKHIVDGLWDAYHDELEDKDGDRVSETNPDGEHVFNLEVLATRSLYEDVPLSILAKRSPTALNGYRKRYE